jgi:hypothetical protein
MSGFRWWGCLGHLSMYRQWGSWGRHDHCRCRSYWRRGLSFDTARRYSSSCCSTRCRWRGLLRSTRGGIIAVGVLQVFWELCDQFWCACCQPCCSLREFAGLSACTFAATKNAGTEWFLSHLSKC